MIKDDISFVDVLSTMLGANPGPHEQSYRATQLEDLDHRDWIWSN